MLYHIYTEAKINDNALVALTLMMAKSLPQQKDMVVALLLECLGDFGALCDAREVMSDSIEDLL